MSDEITAKQYSKKNMKIFLLSSIKKNIFGTFIQYYKKKEGHRKKVLLLNLATISADICFKAAYRYENDK
ncbi:hypothetical protein V1477_012950 [Vespula maculifrons]|uniref:Uncharacterized protein n=1 Tax=Vespula maculifrons TaxID=7453 RepID=A0ABD2BUK1_VESMC